MKEKQKKIVPPNIEIERVLWNSETSRLTALDVYNKSDGRAYFLEVIDSHIKGI